MANLIVHVNKHHIAKNAKYNSEEPTIAVRKGRNGKPFYCKKILLVDSCGKTIGCIDYKKKGLSCCTRV